MQLLDHNQEGVFDQDSRCRDEDEAVSRAVYVLVVGAERGAGHLQVGVGGARHEPEPDAWKSNWHLKEENVLRMINATGIIQYRIRNLLVYS